MAKWSIYISECIWTHCRDTFRSDFFSMIEYDTVKTWPNFPMGPLGRLEVLCEELVDGYTNSRVPRWVTGIALQMVPSSAGLSRMVSPWIPWCSLMVDVDGWCFMGDSFYYFYFCFYIYIFFIYVFIFPFEFPNESTSIEFIGQTMRVCRCEVPSARMRTSTSTTWLQWGERSR